MHRHYISYKVHCSGGLQFNLIRWEPLPSTLISNMRAFSLFACVRKAEATAENRTRILGQHNAAGTEPCSNPQNKKSEMSTFKVR